ncbi:MAG: putative metal-binding motif-containing protein [Deltaproteobacteria bacterium]|nr:putative metal-binding motif-containing protein [Deltaproteobacteria bacterium]
MSNRRIIVWLLAGLVAGAAGCSGDSSNPADDAGVRDEGGAEGDVEPEGGGDADADADSDGVADADDGDAREVLDGPCTTHDQCQDDSWCNGAERCEEGICISGDDPCDDGVECTVDSCEEDSDRCFHTGDDSLCQDLLACNGEEQCLAAGCAPGTSPSCADTSPCTIDTCDEARGGCVHDPRDFDEDGFMTRDYGCDEEGGNDCNDRDPLVNPDAEEICDDIRDNNCDTVADFADPACRPANDSCSGAMLLEDGVAVNASTRGTVLDYTIPCNYYPYGVTDVAFAITIDATLDVIVDITSRSGTLYADFERTCGVASSSMRCLTGSTVQLRRNSLPAGTYYVIVQGGNSDFSITYTTEGPTPIPPNDVCSGAIDIPAAGGSVAGTLLDTTNHYVPSCAGAGAYPDVFYRLVLTEPKKITITAALTPSSYYTYVSLMTTCGDAGSELACAGGYAPTITRNFLDAGTYYIAVDGDQENPFSLNVLLEAPIYPPANDRCPGTEISGGGLFVGTLADTYRDYPPSCSTLSLSDVVYSFTTTEAQDVTVEVTPVGSSTTYVAALRTTCNDAGTEIACRSGNPARFTRRSVAAGTYYVVVSGPTTAPGNQFLLQLTLAPPTPVPPNDLCLGAIDVSAGGSFVGSTSACSDDYVPTCGTAAAYPDIVYNLTLTSPHDVSLALTSSSSLNYLDLRSGACGTGSTSLRCASGAAPTSFNRNVPAGSYWVLVDTSVEANTTLDVTVGPPTTACDGAATITVDYTSGSTYNTSVSGSTSGRPADFGATCAGLAAGPDVPYALVIPVRSTVTAEVTASSYDTALHIRSRCDDPSSEIACDDDGGSCSVCSMLSGLTLEAGTYYLIMDTFSSGTGGTYTLSVTATRL